MKNEISTVITDDTLKSIEQNITKLENDLSFCVNLPEEDKKGGFRLGDKNLGFLVKSKDYIYQHPEFMPGYVSVEEVTKDAVLTEQLTTLHRRLGILIDKIQDTANLAGIEALAGTLAYYNAIKEASKNNIEGAGTIYDDLRKRFPSTRKSKTEVSEK